jgi:hypothetical protein
MAAGVLDPLHVKFGSRAVVLRRSEGTRFSSRSDDEVGGYKARSARSERTERSN